MLFSAFHSNHPMEHSSTTNSQTLEDGIHTSVYSDTIPKIRGYLTISLPSFSSMDSTSRRTL